MINLINLINTAIISASMGANLGIKPIYKANESARTDYTYNFQYQTYATSTTTFYEDVEVEIEGQNDPQVITYEYKEKWRKYTYNSITTPYTAYANIYTHTHTSYNGLTNTYTANGFKNNQTGSERNYNDYFMYIQVDPNNVNINTQITLRLTIDIEGITQGHNNTGSIYGGTLSGTMYYTLDTSVQKYFNMSSWTTSYWNYEAEIINPQNGYLYESRQLQQNISNTMNEQVKTFNIDVQINPTRRNYYLIFLTPIINWETQPVYTTYTEYAEAPGPNKWTWLQTTNNNELWTNPQAHAPLTMSGTYVVNPSTMEVIDIPGLMFQILTMPFTFISMAFNLTLFPGTPYQVNISSLLLTIIGLAILIMILTIIIKAKTGV